MKMSVGKIIQLVPSIVGLVSVNLFWIVSAWPGILSPDSIDTWNQIQRREFSNWHPMIFQAYVFILSMGGKSIGIYSCIQISIVSYTIYSLFGSVLPALKMRVKIWLTSFVMVTPFVGQMSMQVWKDIPFAVYSLLGLSIIGRDVKDRTRFILGVSLFFFGVSFRHEGLANVAIFFILLVFYFRFRKIRLWTQKNSGPEKKFRSLVALVSFSFFIVLMPNTLNALSGAIDRPNWVSDTSFLHDIGYSMQQDDGRFSEVDRKKIELIIGGDSLEGAKVCSSIDQMVFSEGFKPWAIGENDINVKEIWLKNISHGWNEYFYVRWCSAKAFLPFPLQLWMNPIQENEKWKVEWLGWGVAENSNGVVEKPLVNSIAQVNYHWRGLFGVPGGLIAWPGLHLTIILLCRVMLRKKIEFNTVFDLILLWVVSRHILFSIAGQAPGYRYLFITHILSLLLIGILIVSRQKFKNLKS
jgi:hypothetical protein